MENFCECEIHYENFIKVINFFMKNYYGFLKIKGENIKTTNKYNKLENKYKTLIQTIESLPIKGKNCIFLLEKCSNNHKEEIIDINSKLEKIDILSKRIEDYHKILLNKIPNELDDYPDDDEIEDNKNENINDEDNNLNKKIDIRKTKEDIAIIENLLEKSEEFKAKKEEEKRNIVKMVNQTKEYMNNIEVELNRQGEQIDDIEDKVEKGKNLIEEGNNKELVEAAKSAVKRRRIAYQGGLALTLGVIGTIVPGIGNVVGAALGGMIGYGIHKYDKHRLDKALENNKKIREERNNQ